MLEKTKIAFVGTLLVVTPAFVGSCNAPVPTTDQQKVTIEHLTTIADEALDHAKTFSEGSLEYIAWMQNRNDALNMIAKIEQEAGEDFFSSILAWLPLPEPIKKPVAILAGTLVFPRPRRVYGEALKGVGKAAVEVSPFGGKMSPGQAAKSLVSSAGKMLQGVGLLDSRVSPEDAVSNAVKTAIEEAKSKTAAI